MPGFKDSKFNPFNIGKERRQKAFGKFGSVISGNSSKKDEKAKISVKRKKKKGES